MSVEDLKIVVKGAAQNAAFDHLLLAQQSHTKYKQVTHSTLKIQPYMFDNTMTPDDIALLFLMILNEELIIYIF